MPAVQLVEHSEERVVDGANKLLAQRAVNVCESVKGKHRRAVCIPDGRCFGAGRARRYDGRCAGIEGGGDSCGQEVGIYGGWEGEAQVAEGPASEVVSDRCSVGFKELVHPEQRGICCLAVDRRDVRVFEALDELFDSGFRHGGGLTN